MKDILEIKPTLRQLQEKTEALLDQFQIAENTILYYAEDIDKEVVDNLKIDKVPCEVIKLNEHFQSLITQNPEVLNTILESQQYVHEIHKLIIKIKTLAFKRQQVEDRFRGHIFEENGKANVHKNIEKGNQMDYPLLVKDRPKKKS